MTRRGTASARWAAVGASVTLALSACSISVGPFGPGSEESTTSSSGSSSQGTPSGGSSPQGAPTQATSSVTTWPVTEPDGLEWVLVVDEPGEARTIADRLHADGESVISANTAVGMITVRTEDDGFAERAKGVDGISQVVTDRDPGWQAPDTGSGVGTSTALTSGARGTAGATGTTGATGASATDRSRPAADPTPPKGGDPLDGHLWGMRLINAPAAQRVTSGSSDVTVAIIDTGIDVTHPDLKDVVDIDRSRTFVVDRPEIDGPCEEDGCVDPVESDPGGHGTHVAGTVAAAKNGLGVSGVAPGVRLINLRAGSDTGMFFLGPTVNAITAAADLDADVANMSFYIDPWRYACEGGADGDTPEQVAMQEVTLTLTERALADARKRGVTFVGSAGNGGGDLSDPGTDDTSPNYGADPRTRTIDAGRCRSMPSDADGVIGVTAIGPRREIAVYSDIASDPDDGLVDITAPGGNTGGPDAMVLSTYPADLLREEGAVDDDGRVTNEGRMEGVLRSCPDGIGDKDADPQGECGFYRNLVGTSMAAPHVSGTAALIISAKGDPSPDEVAEILGSTARDLPCPSSPSRAGDCVGTPALNGYFGEGLVNAGSAVQ